MIELPDGIGPGSTLVNKPQFVERKERPALCLSPAIGHDAESQSLVPNQRDVLKAEGLGRCTVALAITVASHRCD